MSKNFSGMRKQFSKIIKNMSVINSRTIFALGVMGASLFVLPLVAYGVFTPGETLNPTTCSPTDDGCTVTTPAISGANTDITSLGSTLYVASSTNRIGIGTSTPLYNTHLYDSALVNEEVLLYLDAYGASLTEAEFDVFKINATGHASADGDTGIYGLNMAYDQNGGSTGGTAIISSGDWDVDLTTDGRNLVMGASDGEEDADNGFNTYIFGGSGGDDEGTTSGNVILAYSINDTTEQGLVGIATSTPVAQLDVNGAIRPAQLGENPCEGDAYPEGSIFYSTIGHFLCYCNHTTTGVKMSDDTTACF